MIINAAKHRVNIQWSWDTMRIFYLFHITILGILVQPGKPNDLFFQASRLERSIPMQKLVHSLPKACALKVASRSSHVVVLHVSFTGRTIRFIASYSFERVISVFKSYRLLSNGLCHRPSSHPQETETQRPAMNSDTKILWQEAGVWPRRNRDWKRGTEEERFFGEISGETARPLSSGPYL